MQQYLTQEQVAEKLAAALAAHTRAEIARQMGVSVVHVCHLANGTRQPGPAALKFLGLRKVVVYEPEWPLDTRQLFVL